ncbi:MAG: hypothetical protein M3437_12460 [Chloroflexota bacterium]|nr:hypothetical protein [Chloroflexota bacterium]MDQ5864621.1 hypothetical protein [Chloroflexota bacterium]
MSDLSHSRNRVRRRVRLALQRLLPFRGGPEAEGDAVAEKLKGLNWVDTEEEASAGRQAAAQSPRGDGLAQTIYHARPQNPFSEDF